MALSKAGNKVNVNIILTKPQHTALQAEADRTGSSVSVIVRTIIADWIDEKAHKKGAEA